METITTHGTQFRDAKGRHLILSGINLINKGGMDRSYTSDWGAQTFRQFQQWGFNVLRFGIIWDAIEPEPGQYDEAYLAWISTILDHAHQYDLRVFLDMHQDLFSVLYSDGAPAWATLGADADHAEGALWSDAYLTSDAVKRSFDHFWADDPAADGIGIQTRFAAMWRMLAQRFGDHPAVIGYDLFNEPFPGSTGDMVFAGMVNGIGQALEGGDAGITAEEAMAAFFDPTSREQVLSLLNDHATYNALTTAAADPVIAFDTGPYADFTATMLGAIREVDAESLIFIGNTYFSNMGVPSGIELVTDAVGAPLPNQVFAPHGYDMVVDTEAVQRASDARIDFVLDRHLATQRRLNAPVMFGEWGAHSSYGEGLGHIRHILDRFEDALWSNTYWCYEDDFRDFPVANVLARPYPEATVGELLRYRSSADTLTMEWDEQGRTDGESVIRLPWPASDARIVLDGKELLGNGEEHLIMIPASGEHRSLTLHRASER